MSTNSILYYRANNFNNDEVLQSESPVAFLFTSILISHALVWFYNIIKDDYYL